MKGYQHILIGADLVESDDKAVCEKAEEIAKCCDAQLSVIHVVEHFYTYDLSSQVAQWEEEVTRHVKKELKKIGKKINIPEERQFIEFGKTNKTILKVASEQNVDLIIVGGHSRHGLAMLLLGSTASDVVKGARCDILTIHLEEEPGLSNLG